MIIDRTGKKEWTNRHETFTQTIDNLYNLANSNTGNELNDYNDSTKGIQEIIGEVINTNKRLRVLGGEWSWTKIAATDGILLNTKPLNITFRIRQNNVSPSYARPPDDLYFAQCGVSVKELNDRLGMRKRSLKTSGASNGQTIAGAMSTGTHGSAIDVGAIPDYVVGLHIIVSPSSNVWLERSTYPVVSDSFVHNINAELIRDDNLFNAALVSFGCFSFIHGVMIESEPLFLYECHRLRLPLDNRLYQLMETLDFTNSPLPHGSERPYHFQTLINQYDSGGAYVTVMYKRQYDPTYTPPKTSTPGLVPGDDAPAFIGTITQALPALVPSVVNTLISGSYKLYDNVWGIHGEIFTNTDTHGKVLSAAIGVPLAEVNRVRELLLDLNNTQGPFCGVFAFRYVKASKATLAFTWFGPITCIIELDGVYSQNSYDFYSEVWKELDRRQIPYTFHWGKICELNPQRLHAMYGSKVDSWIAARKKLLTVDVLEVFNNPQVKEWGLDKTT